MKVLSANEIVQETIDWYSVPGRRSVSKNGSCLYKDPATGNMCAFGRCVKEDVTVREGQTVWDGSVRLTNNNLVQLNDVLKPEYQGQDGNFWFHLQHLHDTINFWKDEGGLSEMGKDYVSKNFKIDL